MYMNWEIMNDKVSKMNIYLYLFTFQHLSYCDPLFFINVPLNGLKPQFQNQYLIEHVLFVQPDIFFWISSLKDFYFVA